MSGKRVDSNLIFGGALDKGSGWDKNSIQGDPMFVDPANGDFRVKDGSLALKIGFKIFPMDQFGVKKADLKSIARPTVIPPLEEKVVRRTFKVETEFADATDTNRKEFTATSLRPVDKASFGEFRWILSVSPVNEKGGGENTAIQELGVTFGNE